MLSKRWPIIRGMSIWGFFNEASMVDEFRAGRIKAACQMFCFEKPELRAMRLTGNDATLANLATILLCCRESNALSSVKGKADCGPMEMTG